MPLVFILAMCAIVTLGILWYRRQASASFPALQPKQRRSKRGRGSRTSAVSPKWRDTHAEPQPQQETELDLDFEPGPEPEAELGLEADSQPHSASAPAPAPAPEPELAREQQRDTFVLDTEPSSRAGTGGQQASATTAANGMPPMPVPDVSPAMRKPHVPLAPITPDGRDVRVAGGLYFMRHVPSERFVCTKYEENDRPQRMGSVYVSDLYLGDTSSGLGRNTHRPAQIHIVPHHDAYYIMLATSVDTHYYLGVYRENRTVALGLFFMPPSSARTEWRLIPGTLRSTYSLRDTSGQYVLTYSVRDNVFQLTPMATASKSDYAVFRLEPSTGF